MVREEPNPNVENLAQ
jgi:hypothetical protein